MADQLASTLYKEKRRDNLSWNEWPNRKNLYVLSLKKRERKKTKSLAEQHHHRHYHRNDNENVILFGPFLD